jgi:hypothetical protein
VSNENGHNAIAHAIEITGYGARDTRVFSCFIMARMVPPMSLFLHVVLTTYGVVLAHLHPKSLLARVIF